MNPEPSENGQNAAAPTAPEKPSTPPETPSTPPRPGWAELAGTLVFALFCVELGIFLMVYPWLPIWSQNWFFNLNPAIYSYLVSRQVRGAVTGLGALNILVGLVELGRFLRLLFLRHARRARTDGESAD